MMMAATNDTRALIEMAANVAKAEGQSVIYVGVVPALRLRHHLGLRMAVAVFDPIHPYPALVAHQPHAPGFDG